MIEAFYCRIFNTMIEELVNELLIFLYIHIFEKMKISGWNILFPSSLKKEKLPFLLRLQIRRFSREEYVIHT